jgi:hypothetical protein
MKIPRFRRSACLLLAFWLAGCGKDGDSGTSSSSGPQVAGCSSVVYRGVTYPVTCNPGVASFTVSISTAGNSACFNVTCSAGCVSSVRVC